MRRHPLIDWLTGIPGAIVVGLLLASCVAEAAGPTASSSAAANSVKIETALGETLAFQPAEATVRGSGPITVTFYNRSALAHNLTFTDGLSAASQTIVSPGASEELLLAPPGPGAYSYVCTIHDGMAGTLIVQPAAGGG